MSGGLEGLNNTIPIHHDEVEPVVRNERGDSPEDHEGNGCDRVGEVALAILEVIGLIFANVGTLFLINCIPAVREEYNRLYDVFFGDKKVTVINPEERRDPAEGEGKSGGNPVKVADRVNSAVNPVKQKASKVNQADTQLDPLGKGQQPSQTKKPSPQPRASAPSKEGEPIQPLKNRQPVPKKAKAVNSLDALSPEERDRKITELQLQLKARVNESEPNAILEAHSQQFLAAAKEAENIALELHAKFTQKYVKENSKEEAAPTYWSSGLSGSITTSSLFQLKAAISMTKKTFPGLMVLACDEEQKIEVARLIQIILCGEIAKSETRPSNSCCFDLREISGNHTIQWTCMTESSQANEPYLYNLLNSQGVDFHESFEKALFAFANKYDEAQTKEIMSGIFQIFAENSETVAQNIEDYKNDPLLFALGIQEAGKLPVVRETLSAALKKVKEGSPELEGVLSTLLSLVDVEPIALDALAHSSGCTQEEIQGLMDIKLLELILMKAEWNYANPVNALETLLKGYKEGQVLDKAMTNVQFSYPTNLESMSYYLEHAITIPSNRFLEERVCDYFSEEVVVATVNSEDDTYEIHIPENHPKEGRSASKKYIAMKDLLFSWQTPSSVMDYLASRIDDSIVLQQPAHRFITLTTEMDERCQKLDEMANRGQEGGYISQAANVFSRWWNGEREVGDKSEDEVARDVEETLAALNAASETLQQFLRAAVLSDQSEQKVNPPLVALRDSLTHLHAALAKRQSHLATHKQLDKSELLTDPLKQARGLLSQIEENDVIGKTVLERFKGLFTQTQNHKEISWKVRRYEEQILQLKNLFEKNFPDELQEVVTQAKGPADLSLSMSLAGSWINMDVNRGAVVRGLYRELQKAAVKIQQNKEKYQANKKARYTQNHLDDVREGYNGLLKAFRKAFNYEAKQTAPDDQNRQYLEQIGTLLYTGVNLRKRSEKTVSLFNAMGAQVLGQPKAEFSRTDEDGRKALHPEVQEIETLYDRMNAAPYTAKAPLLYQNANSLRGQYNRNFDPNMQSNPMHVLYELKIQEDGKEERSLQVIGMGCPTNEDIAGDISINPEWRATMQGYKRAGKRHLYVSNQNLIPKEGFIAKYVIDGDETGRGNAVMQMQKDEDVEGAYFAITLSKNSTFYAQTGEFADKNNAKDFKEELYKQMVLLSPEESGNWISDEVRALVPNLNFNILQISAYIHDTVFAGKPELTQEERKRFVDIFQSKFVKYVAIQGGFHSYNKTCKDGIDRAADSNAESYVEDAITFAHQTGNGNIRPQDRVTAQNLILARALFVRKRPVIHERLERFNESYDFRLKHGPELLKLHISIFPDTVITPV